jgi:hypothetical protein
MDLIFRSKRERAIFYLFVYALRTMLVLVATRICLDYFHHGFLLYAAIAYIVMAGGGMIMKRMYLPTYEAIVINARAEKVPNVFNFAMLACVMFVSVVGGALMYFNTGNIFASVFVPFFFFSGAFSWFLAVSDVRAGIDEAEEERNIKFVVKKKGF